MRRQTSISGINPAGSSRALRLDPLSLPVSFAAHDVRADGQVRHIDLDPERVVFRRVVLGMRMAIRIRVRDFLGVIAQGSEDTRTLVLRHRDPSLSIPLFVSNDNDELAAASAAWSQLFALPELPADSVRDPAPRRRRRNVISARRPKFLVRRRGGGDVASSGVYRGEREIIARD